MVVSKITPLGLLLLAILILPLTVTLDLVSRAIGFRNVSWMLSVVYLVPLLAVVSVGWATVVALRERRVTGANLAAILGGLGLTLLFALAGYLAWAFRDF
jgi:endonuclease/exonuclease/phosphatase (EEP) superfamily protein YafD